MKRITKNLRLEADSPEQKWIDSQKSKDIKDGRQVSWTLLIHLMIKYFGYKDLSIVSLNGNLINTRLANGKIDFDPEQEKQNRDIKKAESSSTKSSKIRQNIINADKNSPEQKWIKNQKISWKFSFMMAIDFAINNYGFNDIKPYLLNGYGLLNDLKQQQGATEIVKTDSDIDIDDGTTDFDVAEAGTKESENTASVGQNSKSEHKTKTEKIKENVKEKAKPKTEKKVQPSKEAEPIEEEDDDDIPSLDLLNHSQS